MHRSILIVEDNIDLARAVTALLRRAGFNASCALDLPRARSAMADHVPSLVILDITLPSGDGLDLLEEMRCSLELSDVPVVIFTAIDDPAFRERARRLGAADYVVKGAIDGTTLSRLAVKHLAVSPSGHRLPLSPIGDAAVKTLQ